MATIRIHDLQLRAIIGTHDAERTKKQTLRAEIAIDYDAEQAIAHDDISAAVDYEALSREIIDAVSATKFFLIETLAKHIAEIIMKNARATNVTVTLEKPRAIPHSRSVAVTVTARK